MSSHRREQIIENCRWLLDQEVQIITFTTRKYFNTAPVIGCSRGPYELHHYAAVLPKQCSLKSLARSDIEDKIIFKEFSLLSSDGAIHTLHGSIEKRIGKVLEENDGHIRINEDEVPEEYLQVAKVTSTPVKSSDSAAAFMVQATQLLEDVRKNGEEILDNVRKKSEEIEREFTNVRKVKNMDQRLSSAGAGESLNAEPAQNDSTGPSQLTNHNLALLEKESTRKGPKKTNNNPRDLSGNVEGLRLQQLPHKPPQLKTNPEGVPHEIEESTPAFQLPLTPQHKPAFHPPPNGTPDMSRGLSIELGTPTSSSQTSSIPILTPTSSTASDTTIASRPDPFASVMRSLVRDEVKVAMEEYRQSLLHPDFDSSAWNRCYSDKIAEPNH